MPIFIPPDEAAFTTSLGKVITRWNQLEAMLKFIVKILAGGQPGADILSAHLGNMDLLHSAQALANTCLDGHQQDHFLHFLKMYDRLRMLRNFFVHGIGWVGMGEDGVERALVQTIKAKGKLTISTYMVKPYELTETIEQLEIALEYS